jgi:SpoVK/Ycf46/Vps4 family AAA+-type ATPase
MLAMEEADAAASASGDPDAPCELRPLTAADFASARSRVGASIVRGVAVEPPPISWDDIGGLEDVKRRLRQAVEWPLLHAPAFARLGLRAPRGLLLHGPPGCSKTCLARAAAHASGATLIPLSGAQLFSMYLGEGERALQRAFARARAAAPAIILLDEADGVGAKRADSGAGSGGSGAEERLLCTLLAELDGIAPASGVLLIAATNRPGALDAALLRPGRLDVHLFVPPPDAPGRAAALRIHTRAMALAADVDVEQLAAATEGASGAEIASMCAEAAFAALREDGDASCVQHRHFVVAVAAAPPSLSAEELAVYASFGTRRMVA